jgi:eukaryotic-like serine/threonine-protein kinase
MAVETELLPPRYASPGRLGQGAMGDIYLATDEALGRRVAVKVLSERYAQDEAIRARFKREALAAARLSGEPGAVTIFDVGEWQGRPFIVMEHVEGGSLADRLQREDAQPPARALAWLEQAATVLDAAHRQGIVHRDIKPANLLLDARGQLHMADFGIASAAGLDSMTLTGTVLGTAGYLSPEQAQGHRAGPASDIYALGVVAYELLCGTRPFESESPTAEAAAHANAPVPSISERCRDLPPELDAVFQRVLAKRPEDRYETATAFVRELRNALARAAGTVRLEPPVVRAQRGWWPVVAGGLLLAAAAAGALLAVLLVGRGGDAPKVQVVTRTIGGHTTTVLSTATAPAPAPPPPPPPPPPTAGVSGGHALNDRAYRLMQQGDYESALPLLQQAVRDLRGTGPGDLYEGYANYNLGYTLYRLGRCGEALAYLERAAQLEPDRPEPESLRKRAERC